MNTFDYYEFFCLSRRLAEVTCSAAEGAAAPPRAGVSGQPKGRDHQGHRHQGEAVSIRRAVWKRLNKSQGGSTCKRRKEILLFIFTFFLDVHHPYHMICFYLSVTMTPYDAGVQMSMSSAQWNVFVFTGHWRRMSVWNVASKWGGENTATKTNVCYSEKKGQAQTDFKTSSPKSQKSIFFFCFK